MEQQRRPIQRTRRTQAVQFTEFAKFWWTTETTYSRVEMESDCVVVIFYTKSSAVCELRAYSHGTYSATFRNMNGCSLLSNAFARAGALHVQLRYRHPTTIQSELKDAVQQNQTDWTWLHAKLHIDLYAPKLERQTRTREWVESPGWERDLYIMHLKSK